MNKARQAKRTTMINDCMVVLKDSPYKTPLRAIKGFCLACENATYRKGKRYTNVPIYCEIRHCPLFPFRNGNPEQSIKSREKTKCVAAMHEARLRGSNGTADK